MSFACCRYSPAPISIKHLLDHGKASDAKVKKGDVFNKKMSHISSQGSFFFLKREIPTRLAGMIMELRLLPPDLLQQKECTEVLNDYIASFRWCDAVCIFTQCLRTETLSKSNCNLVCTGCCLNNIKKGCKKKDFAIPCLFLFSTPIHFRDLVTYERETGDVLERFNESLNMVRTRSKIVARFRNAVWWLFFVTLSLWMCIMMVVWLYTLKSYQMIMQR